MESCQISDKRAQMLVTLVAAISVFMNTLDYSMLNISLPVISQYFRVNLAMIAWLPLIYLLIVTSSLLGFGKLGDMKGYKGIFILGLGIFTVGTALCALAPTMNLLLVFRGFQSAGEAMSSPIAIAMITYFLPASIRGRALGIVALAQGLGFASGSMLGGYINSHFAWRGIFLVNIPIGIAAMWASFKVIPGRQEKSADKRFDIVGAITVFIALASLLFFINSVAKFGLKHPLMAGCLGLSLIAFLVFFIQERRITYPILDLGLFKNINFTLAVVATFLAIFVILGFSFLAPFYLELIHHLSVSTVGTLLVIPSLMMMVLAPFAGRISDQIGSRLLCSVGAALLGAAFAAFSSFNTSTHIAAIAVSLFLLGCGAGLFMAPNNKLVMLQAPSDKQGVASGVYKMLLSTGSVFGIALFPLVIMAGIKPVMAARHIEMSQIRNYPDIISIGFRNAFLFGAALCLLTFVFSFFARDKK